VFINLFGAVKAVKGSVGNILFRREVEDTACALLQFESGPRAVLSVTHAAREPQDTLDIFGSVGSIHADVLNEGRLRIRTAEGERLELHPPHANLHLPLIENFAQSVVKGVAPRVDGRVGLAVAQVIEEIYTDAAETSFSSDGVGRGAAPEEFAASGD
jgi:predicted dehydrogenase